MYSLPSPIYPAPLLPFMMFEHAAGIVQEFFRLFQASALGVRREYASGRSRMALTREQEVIFQRMMRSVKKTAIPGRYLGGLMNLRANLIAADMSGDRNHIHIDPEHPLPELGALIAHGMNGVTQVFAALSKEVAGQGLAPTRADISFRKPVIVGSRTRLDIRVAPAAEAPLEWDVTVFTLTGKTVSEKPVITMRVKFAKNPSFTKGDWFRWLMSAWRISALLAEIWPGCRYYQQVLSFHQLMEDEELVTSVRGTGLNPKGHCLVTTQAYEGRSFIPSVTGEAIIVLPATV